MALERAYYEDINYHPYIFYVVFEVRHEKLEISTERHHVDELPEGIDIALFNRYENGEYMDSLLGGTLGYLLNESSPSLFSRVHASEKWAVIRGEVKNDSTLDYMRNVIGLVQAFVETGALGVLDLQTFTLLSSEEWTETIFKKEFNPYSHFTIITSEMDDGTVWVHTRGMRKFGRPDVSIVGVQKVDVNDAMQVAKQVLYYGCLGVFFSKATKLHTHVGKSFHIFPRYVDDRENDDFNNAYYEIAWADCTLVE